MDLGRKTAKFCIVFTKISAERFLYQSILREFEDRISVYDFLSVNEKKYWQKTLSGKML